MDQNTSSTSPMNDASFFPDGTFDWYNPADWLRNAKLEAYKTMLQGLSAVSQVEQTAATAAQDAANKAGAVTLKYVAGFALVGVAAIVVLRNTNQKPRSKS